MICFVCLLSAIVLSLFLFLNKTVDSFQNSTSDATNMDNYYKLLLNYVQTNPDRSLNFIKSIQQKFCTDNIDFKNLSNILPVFT